MDTIFGFQKLNRTCLCYPIASLRNGTQKIPTPKQNPLKPRLPKSSPTRLQINSKPSSPPTKIDPQIKALDSIIRGLESKRTGIADNTFVFVLEKCYELGAIKFVIRTHRLIPDLLLGRDVDLSSNLIRFYTKFGRIEEAHQVFDKMSKRHLYASPWNALIFAYNKLCLYEDAMELYFQMVGEGVEPDNGTFPLVLKACAWLGLVEIGKQLHSRIIRQGFEKEQFELNGLVYMYAKCGDLVEARKLFDKIEFKSLALFTSMLNGYITRELLADALYIFRCMMRDGHEPGLKFISKILALGLPLKLALDSIISGLESKRTGIADNTFVFVLEKCYELGAIDFVIRTHRLIPDLLLGRDVDLSSNLIRFYTEFGRIEEARQVFDKMSNRHLYASPWNALIFAYNKLGLYEDAMELYFQMVGEGVELDKGTFPLVLKACAELGLVEIGEQLHSRLIRQGVEKWQFECNGLVYMYAESGDLVEARKLFDKIEFKSLASFTSMLNGYITRRLLADALYIFRCMMRDGHEPGLKFISKILSLGLPLKLAAEIHGWVLRRGAEWNLAMVDALLITYSKNGRSDACKRVLNHMFERNMSLWNPIISSHQKHQEAPLSSNQMDCSFKFVSLLSTCARLRMVKNGERLFALMTEIYGGTPRREHYGCLVNLYGRAGLIGKAYDVIMDRTELEVDEKAWGALLYACYLHNNVEIGEKAAERLFDLEPFSKHNFEFLIQIYGKSGRYEDVERIRMMMLDRGFKL